MPSEREIPTVLLQRLREGDLAAAERLLPIVYDELKAVAQGFMQREVTGHTLQATALVHEAWVRLSGSTDTWESESHFIGVAARAMRQVLVDHARAKKALKRGNRARAHTDFFDQVASSFEGGRLDVIALHEALDRLTEMDAPLARMVELRFFAGLSIPETARVLETSPSSVERQWRVARAWLRREVPPTEP